MHHQTLFDRFLGHTRWNYPLILGSIITSTTSMEHLCSKDAAMVKLKLHSLVHHITFETKFKISLCPYINIRWGAYTSNATGQMQWSSPLLCMALPCCCDVNLAALSLVCSAVFLLSPDKCYQSIFNTVYFKTIKVVICKGKLGSIFDNERCIIQRIGSVWSIS